MTKIQLQSNRDDLMRLGPGDLYSCVLGQVLWEVDSEMRFVGRNPQGFTSVRDAEQTMDGGGS